MTKLDHDIYSIKEAAEILGRTEIDIVKWGSSGKIELGVLFSGTIHKGYYEQVDPGESASIVEEALTISNRFMVIDKDDLLELYKMNVSINDNKIPVEIYRFKAKPRRFNEIDKAQGGDDHIPIYYSDLFIYGKELERFQKTINDTEDTQQPTKKVENLPCLDPTHDYFAEELCIAIKAWKHLYENRDPGTSRPKGGHKEYIKNWLKENHSDLSKNCIKRLSTIINPNKSGGASPTF